MFVKNIPNLNGFTLNPIKENELLVFLSGKFSLNAERWSYFQMLNIYVILPYHNKIKRKKCKCHLQDVLFDARRMEIKH